MKTTLSFLILLFSITFCSAQKTDIKLAGKVISFEESLGLEGVSVSVKGTNNFSGTQADGTFSISVNPDDKILIFSLQEYETKEIAINSNSDYDVILKRKGSDGDAIHLARKQNNDCGSKEYLSK